MSLRDRLLELFAPATQHTPPPDDASETAYAVVMLLLEVAWGDHQIAAIEIEHIEHAVGRVHGLTPLAAIELVARARRDHDTATSIHPFTRLLNERLGPDEKIELLVELWRLASVDERIDLHEQRRVRAIAELLHIPESEFVAARRRASNQNAGDTSRPPS